VPCTPGEEARPQFEEGGFMAELLGDFGARVLISPGDCRHRLPDCEKSGSDGLPHPTIQERSLFVGSTLAYFGLRILVGLVVLFLSLNYHPRFFLSGSGRRCRRENTRQRFTNRNK
jgi:hypothetical protein